EPPMFFRIAATASACSRVFSPVSSVSPAISGSAKARARASAFACCGSACSAAASRSGTGVPSALSAAWLFIGIRSGGQQEGGHRLHLVGCDEGGRVTHPFEFDEARLGSAAQHLLRRLAREQVRLRAAQQQRAGTDGVVQLPERRLARE